MPILKQYQLFISHSWKDDSYNRLITLLNNTSYFKLYNYSVEKSEPLKVQSRQALYQGLKNKILHANIVLIIAGMYVNYSDAILEEIQIALELNKPIIAVTPWGNTRIPIEIQRVAKDIVGWNTDSIIGAIRKYAN